MQMGLFDQVLTGLATLHEKWHHRYPAQRDDLSAGSGIIQRIMSR